MADRTAALLFFEIGDFVLCAVYKLPVKPGDVKSSHSKIAVYLHLWVLMASKTLL